MYAKALVSCVCGVTTHCAYAAWPHHGHIAHVMTAIITLTNPAPDNHYKSQQFAF
jgi:hypothetical protein